METSDTGQNLLEGEWSKPITKCLKYNNNMSQYNDDNIMMEDDENDYEHKKIVIARKRKWNFFQYR